MSNIILTIIIPVHNGEKYLNRCLDSIGMYDNVEVIIIDDGSTDNSASIIKQYPYKLISLPKNAGVSNARNLGISVASGNYITFLDADDEYTSDGINNILSAISKYPDADIIQLNHYRQYSANDRRLRFHNPTCIKFLPEMPAMWMVVWNKIFKKDLLSGITFLRDIHRGEDELFVLDCCNIAKKIYCYDKLCVIYHLDNSESLSHNLTKEDLLSEQIALIEFIRRCNDPKVYRAAIKRISDLWTDNPTYKKVFNLK